MTNSFDERPIQRVNSILFHVAALSDKPSSYSAPHLPNREDFHPKRNQARQKLSTLPKSRFKDLASDVYYELGKRYPEFKEPEVCGNRI
jgi:hypothetical protein